MSLSIVKIEVSDPSGEVLATVERFDEHSASIDLKQDMHDATSWDALSAEIAQAIGMVCPKESTK